jgi:hypothetical protein
MSTNFNYQVDYGDGAGWQNAYPDSSLHDQSCNDPDCQGCWDHDDYEVWFQSIEDYDDGNIKRARVLFGNQVLEERDFPR